MPADHSRAFWVAAPGRGEIRDEALPQPGAGDILVRTLYSGISRGTEATVFRGGVPASEHQRMRAPFQAGDFPAPVKYGYTNVGQVEQGPRDMVGRNVFVLYPHQTSYVVPAQAAHVLPVDVPASRAVLAANLETAINGLWDAHPQIGDRITVVGAGTVGCLSAWLAARIVGCEVRLVDVNSRRQEVAAALGVSFTSAADVEDDADLVIHTSGSPSGLEVALRAAALEATIVEMSWYGDQRVAAPLGEAFHARRLVLRSSQVGRIPSSQAARWDFRRRMTLALRLLSDATLDVLISGESDFEALPEVMAALAANPGDTLCHRIRYPQDTRTSGIGR
jgi:threonine dehydrogenase-like Zn-dependent dehydrogenase